MYVDYHVHTSYSDDSDYPMEQVVRDAIEKGIEELCFTDHVDYGIKTDWDSEEPMKYRKGGPGEPEQMPVANVNYPKYVEEIGGLQQKYEGQIRLKLGLEFGMQRHTISQYQKLFGRYPFDFIILSVHEVDDKELWNQDFQRGKTQEEYQMRYYEEMLELVRSYHDYSVLGHVDLMDRYDLAGEFPFEKREKIITEILKTVIADGKGIEVNTSCHRYGLTDLTPSSRILQLYRDLGGRVLTIGSDSHKPAHLGAFIPETLQQLKCMGFEEICTFEKMESVFHKL